MDFLWGYAGGLEVAGEDFFHHDEHAVDVLVEGAGEDLVVYVNNLGLNVLVLEASNCFFEVGEGHYAVGVAMEELEGVLGLPVAAEVFAIHEFEQAIEVIFMSFGVFHVEDFV